VFRIYDDDEDGVITFDNLERVAKDLGEDVTEEELVMMVKMGDKNNISGVKQEDFLDLMTEMGINNDKKRKQDACNGHKHLNDMELEFAKAK